MAQEAVGCLGGQGGRSSCLAVFTCPGHAPSSVCLSCTLGPSCVPVLPSLAYWGNMLQSPMGTRLRAGLRDEMLVPALAVPAF